MPKPTPRSTGSTLAQKRLEAMRNRTAPVPTTASRSSARTAPASSVPTAQPGRPTRTSRAPVKPEPEDVIDAAPELEDADESFGPEDVVDEPDDVVDTETPPAVTRTPLNVSGSRQATPAGGAIATVQRPRVRALDTGTRMVNRSRVIDQNDMIMPKLRIAQGLSKAVAAKQVELGHWYITGRNESLGELVYVIPVDMRKSQSLFKQGVGVLCRSYDLVRGMGDPGGLCQGTEEEIANYSEDDRGCEFRLWTVEEGTQRRIPPPCQLAYNFPVLIVDPAEVDGELSIEDGTVRRAMLTFRSTATQAARQIVTDVMQGEEPIWHRNVFSMELVSKSNMKGTFFVPQVEWLGLTPDKLNAEAAAYAQLCSDKFVNANIDANDDE